MRYFATTVRKVTYAPSMLLTGLETPLLFLFEYMPKSQGCASSEGGRPHAGTAVCAQLCNDEQVRSPQTSMNECDLE